MHVNLQGAICNCTILFLEDLLCPTQRAAQMGGPEGVRKAERTSITLSCAAGMKVHALPRAGKA